MHDLTHFGEQRAALLLRHAQTLSLVQIKAELEGLYDLPEPAAQAALNLIAKALQTSKPREPS